MEPSEKWLQDLAALVQARNQEATVLRAEKGELESVLTKIVTEILTTCPEDVKKDADVGEVMIAIIRDVVRLRIRCAQLEQAVKMAKEIIRIPDDKKEQSIEWGEWNKKLEEAVLYFSKLLAGEDDANVGQGGSEPAGGNPPGPGPVDPGARSSDGEGSEPPSEA